MSPNPHYPAFYPFQLGTAYCLTGQYPDAIAAFQDTLRRNPNFLTAYTFLAWSYLSQWIRQWSQDPQDLERALEATQQAVALSDSTHWAHGMLSAVYLWQKRHAEALAEAERALALNAHEPLSHANVGNVLNFAGRAAESLARMEQVDCATAFYIYPAFCFSVLGDAYYLTERYEEAIAAYDQVLSHKRSPFLKQVGHLGLAASYSELGRAEEARAEIATVLKINPQFSLAGIRQRWPYKDPTDLERLLTALRKAGLG